MLRKYWNQKLQCHLEHVKIFLVKEAQHLLQDMSITQWDPFLESVSTANLQLVFPSILSMFTYEPLHILHLGTPKAIKTYLIIYLSNQLFHAFLGQERWCKPFRSCRTDFSASSRSTSIPLCSRHSFSPHLISYRLITQYLLYTFWCFYSGD